MIAVHAMRAPRTPRDAIQLSAHDAGAKYLGGGTNLVDLMRETIERPDALVDVTGLSSEIEETRRRRPADRRGGEEHRGRGAPRGADALSRCWRAPSWPARQRQIRNMATVGGNILQRTRCTYFYDDAGRAATSARPAQGCDAIDGFNRNHAILGASPACVATHPSDMCVALAALDAVVHLEGPGGARTLPLVDLHRLPGDRPDIETELAPGELITAVELPALPFAARSTYRKVRDRASYAFALVSVAAALDLATAARSRTCGSRWAASRTSPGAPGRPKRRCGAGRRPRTSFRAAAEAELADAVAAARQRVQDRARQAHDHRRRRWRKLA